MEILPQLVVLNNGKSIIIRNCISEDAEQLMHCVKTYLNDSEYIPKESDEFNLTLEQEVQWIQTLNDKTNSLLLVAEHEGVIIGNIDLTGSGRRVMAHTAAIGMGMLREWRNTGVGTELLWLQVYLQNEVGIRLYRKLNFEEHGIIKNYFKHKGKYFDVLTMSLSVK